MTIATWLLGSMPFSTVFWTIVVGVCTPTSFQLSRRWVAGSAPRYRSTSGCIVGRSKLPMKMNVKSLASANRSL